MARASMKFGIGNNRRHYYNYKDGLSKREALRLSKKLRRRGYKARIYEETHGYTVFTIPSKYSRL